MPSKQDCSHFFEKVAYLERKMIYGVMDALTDLEDVYVVRALQRVAGEELKHYAMILDLLQMKFLTEKSERDRRLVNRTSGLGAVHLIPKVRRKGPERDVFCVDLTFLGMCFESDHQFTIGEEYQVRILLFDKSEPVTASGKIVWGKEILPGVFMFGMQFDV